MQVGELAESRVALRTSRVVAAEMHKQYFALREHDSM